MMTNTLLKTGKLLVMIMLLMAVFCSIGLCEAGDESPWRIWRFSEAVDIDGASHSPEELAADLYICLHESNAGFMYTGEEACCVQWTETDSGIHLSGEDVYLTLRHGEDGTLFYTLPELSPYAMYGLESSVHFSPVSKADKSDKYAGRWLLSGSQGVALGMRTDTTIVLGEDGMASHESEAGALAAMFNEDYANLGCWIVLDDRMFFADVKSDVVNTFDFSISGDMITMNPLNLPEELQFINAVPFDMNAPARYDFWAGKWYFESTDDGVYSVYAMELSQSGTAIFTHADGLNDPENVFSFEGFLWNPAENGVVLMKNKQEAGRLEMNGNGSLRYALSDGSAISLKRPAAAYTALLESAKETGRAVKDYQGVWDVRGVLSEGALTDVQLVLEPDAGAVLRKVIHADDPRETQGQDKKNLCWQFVREGIAVYPAGGSMDDAENTVIFPVEGGSLFTENTALSRSADGSKWNGGNYGEAALANYMSTGYVGIWKNVNSLDNFDDEFFHLCLGADGQAELIHKGNTYPLTWKPTEGGIAIKSAEDIRAFLIYAEKWEEIKESGRAGSMEWNNVSYGIVRITQINDYWSSGDSGVSEPIIKYTENGDGTITITDLFNAGTEVRIPGEVDGMKVTALGDSLFSGDIQITDVVIPEGVERIGSLAFYRCSSLESVTLPESLKEIGDEAFRSCEMLNALTLPGSLKIIGARAFDSCVSLTGTLKLDGDGLEIGASAFTYCQNLTALEIGPGVSVIGEDAFRACASITELNIPSTVSRIGAGAFSSCYDVQALVLGDGISAMGENAFENCDDLTSVRIPGSIGTVPGYAFSRCNSLEIVEIGEGITAIGEGAFSGCESLTTVILPESLEEIGSMAFNSDIALEAIDIPAGVTHIGRAAFAYSDHLKNVVLPEGLVSIDEIAFTGCIRLQSLYIPETVSEIGKYIVEDTDAVLLGGANVQAYAEQYGYAFAQASRSDAENNNYGAFLPNTGDSGAVDDSEQSLRYLLFDETGTKEYDYFVYGDFDGDGVHEAFAMITEGYESDIWFVSNNTVKSLQEDKSYYYLRAEGSSAPYVITAEEGYGGSGSTTHMWIVSGGEPKKIDTDIYGGMSYGGNGVFHAYPSAFDGWTDGTGHTWKCYYYYMDGESFREYGGIYITMDDLLKFDGAQEIIDGVRAEGYTVLDIIYRENNIINVNLRRDMVNDNLTLVYDETSVTDTGERYGGTYSLANSPYDATYPAAFIEPTGASAKATPEPTPTLPPLSGPLIPIVENLTFSIYKKPCTDIESIVALAAFNADGSQKAEIELFNYYEGSSEYTDFGMQLYRLSDGWYYAESWFMFEGIQRYYILLRLDGSRFVIEQIVEDPGYSDGYGLRDPYTYADYYVASSESPNVVADMSDILNDMFAGHGLVFTWPNAVSVDGELLLDLTKADLGFRSASATVVPVDNTAGKQDVATGLGVFNYSTLRHVRKVDHTAEQGIEDYKVWLNEDVYYGGSDGYQEDWLTSDGIFAETELDLDGDGTDEYAVLYHKAFPVDYDYQEHEFHLAVYEPENGGYRLAADVPVNYDLMGMESERFARIVSGSGGTRIFTGYIAFWEGGGGGVTGYMYGYDGSEIYCDLVIGATTDSPSFVVNHRVPAKDAYEIWRMSEFYEENSSELSAYGVVHGENLHTVDFRLWTKDDPYTYMEPDRFEGIALAADFAKDYGVDIRAEINGDYYKLYCDGGKVFSESTEEWSSGNAYVHIRNLTSLDHFASGSTGTTTSTNGNTGGGTVVTGTVRITGSVNLRSGPGINYGKVSSAKKGKTLPYLGETVYDDRSPAVAWYKVERKNGEAAWVSEKYAVLEDVQEVAATAAPVVTAAPLPTLAPIATEETVTYGSVKTTGSVNLRSGPGLNYSQVSSTKKGKTFTYLGETVYDNRTPPVAWYKIQLKNGDAAWISSKYAKLTDPVDNGGDAGSTFKTLSKGSKGDRVVDLQDMLAYLGYHTGTVDGDYGNQTVKSVTAFQNAYGLNPTGKVDEKTWNAICEAAGR